MPMSFCYPLRGSQDPAPRLYCFFHWSPFVFASPSLPNQKLSESAPGNSGKAMEAEWGPFLKNKKCEASKGIAQLQWLAVTVSVVGIARIPSSSLECSPSSAVLPSSVFYSLCFHGQKNVQASVWNWDMQTENHANRHGEEWGSVLWGFKLPLWVAV